MIKGKGYPTLVAQVNDPNIVFVTGEEGRETAELVTTLNTWKKDRKFVVSRILREEKDSAQLSFLEGEEYEYFFFVTNTKLQQVPPNIITCFDEDEGKMIATWNPGEFIR